MEEKQCFLYNTCNHKDCKNSFCLRKYKVESIYELSMIPPVLRKHTTLKCDADGTDFDKLDFFSKNIDKNILDFVKEGKNLYLHSSICGNGKTTMSLRLAESYILKVWPKAAIECKVLFISVPRFLLELKSNISKHSDYADFINENALKADLVIWDDLGHKGITEFEASHLLSLIDNRISNGKSNIYTSNLTLDEMYNALGARLASRVCNYSIDLELHGADKRKYFSKNENGDKI